MSIRLLKCDIKKIDEKHSMSITKCFQIKLNHFEDGNEKTVWCLGPSMLFEDFLFED